MAGIWGRGGGIWKIKSNEGNLIAIERKFLTFLWIFAINDKNYFEIQSEGKFMEAYKNAKASPSFSARILNFNAAASAALLALSSPLFAQSSEQIYFGGVSSSAESAYLNRPSNWYFDSDKANPFDGSFDGDNYGRYDAEVSASGSQGVSVTGSLGDILNWGNFNYSHSEMNVPNSSFALLTMGGSKTLRTYGDWNLNLGLSASATNMQHNASIRLWEKSLVEIGGNWNIRSNKNGSGGWLGISISDGYSDNPGAFRVKGNVVFSPESSAILSTANSSFTVDGAIDLNGTGSWTVFNTADSIPASVTRTIGGLGDADGKGVCNGNLFITNWRDAEATIVFSNSKAYDFSGSFKASSTYKNLLNLTMMASDARNGRQTMRFLQGGTSWPNGYTVTDADINNVEVNSGRLDIGMYDGMKGANLAIYGYSGNASDAVFSAAGLSSGQEIGRVQFDSMTFYEGTIVFDLGEVDCDFIQINGGVRKDAPNSQITFDMNITKDDLQMYLEALGAETMEWDLMSFKTDDSDFALTDIILKTQAGIDGELSFLADDSSGLTTVQLSLGVIPEPAAVAAIIGAIALSLAALRRRK